MSTTPIDGPIDLAGFIPVELAADVSADLVRTLILNADNSRAPFAMCAVDLLVAVARALSTDEPLCDIADDIVRGGRTFNSQHIAAAIVLLGDAYRAERLDPEDIVRGLPARLERMLKG